MNIREFMKTQKLESEYCACLIDQKGEIYPIKDGHLNALIDYYGDKDIMSKLDIDISPMFWLIGKTGVVVVDYENQIHSGELTQEQRLVLIELSDNGRIKINLFDIHGKCKL